MVYNSDTESEEGDPRYRVGSRFSSYHNESNKAEDFKKADRKEIHEEIRESPEKA